MGTLSGKTPHSFELLHPGWFLVHKVEGTTTENWGKVAWTPSSFDRHRFGQGSTIGARTGYVIEQELLDEDREPIRRASTLFALPHLAPLGAKLVWGTADCIWTALGDTSRDVNWYSKRATLSGVFAASVLFWLGDDSANSVATREFIDRRIADVMRFEKAKAQVRETPSLRPLGRLIDTMTQGIKAPPKGPRSDVPGYWHTPK